MSDFVKKMILRFSELAVGAPQICFCQKFGIDKFGAGSLFVRKTAVARFYLVANGISRVWKIASPILSINVEWICRRIR